MRIISWVGEGAAEEGNVNLWDQSYSSVRGSHGPGRDLAKGRGLQQGQAGKPQQHQTSKAGSPRRHPSLARDCLTRARVSPPLLSGGPGSPTHEISREVGP